jgi:hypothetical protein
VALLISVMYGTCFHLGIFTVGGGCGVSVAEGRGTNKLAPTSLPPIGLRVREETKYFAAKAWWHESFAKPKSLELTLKSF